MLTERAPKTVVGGGGGTLGGGWHRPRDITVRRTAAIGDALCATVVADKLIEQGMTVAFQTHSACHCLIKRHPRITHVEEPQHTADINLDGAYELNPARRRLHFHDMFIGKANEQLAHVGINLGPAYNCRPRIRVSPIERQAAQTKFGTYPKPWVFICPRSDTYACRQVPDGIWREAARQIQGTKFWIGRHPAPEGIVDLHCQHLDNVIVWLTAADLLVTVDTGPMHIAAALGIPIVALGQSSSPDLHLNDQTDFITICPKLDCLNCQQNLCPINGHQPPCQQFNPQFIAEWANAKLRQVYGEGISAVVPIYQPEVATVNRCLEALIPQVSEIIVSAEMNSRVPDGLLQHEKIRLVRKGIGGIGYGRNTNFGVRHTTGKYLLLINDDCFLNPDAVSRMMAEMKPGVGMVCPLLRKPDGLIWHAGKRRSPGMRGWAHIGFGHRDCEIKEPTEMENCAGTAVLVRREAHFAFGGFDEEIFVYSEDDLYALNIRRQGWKIMFTPFAEGIHQEHQSTNKVGSIMDHLKRSNAIFDRKIGRAYFDHNANNSMGNFNF